MKTDPPVTWETGCIGLGGGPNTLAVLESVWPLLAVHVYMPTKWLRRALIVRLTVPFS